MVIDDYFPCYYVNKVVIYKNNKGSNMNIDYAKAIDHLLNLDEAALAAAAVTLAKMDPELFNRIVEGKTEIADNLLHHYVRAGKKIDAIKRHKEIYGSDLLGAKLAVERLEKFYGA